MLMLSQRVGLPVSEFRRVAAEIGHAMHELTAAREEMVRAQIPLVEMIARRFRHRSSLDISDLIQEGNLGLMRAIEKFDYRRGVRVSTYAVWWIRQSISRAIADQGRTIRIPVHMKETVARVLKAKRKLTALEGRAPTSDEVAATAGIPLPRVEQVLSLVLEPASLDLPVGEDGDATLGDLIPATDTIDPHAAAEASALRDLLGEALSALNPRERKIITLRFGMDGSAGQTLEEISKIFGVTRERIRQIEANALNKLRHPKNARKLASFVEV
jgi:RNA polymerase primary sigma factor